MDNELLTKYDLDNKRSEDIVEALQNTNADIKYIDVHGKDYAEVKERIKAFRRVFPEGAISTKIIELDEKHCVFKASVFNENGSLLAEGHAHESMATVKFKDSMLEVAETSAIGRALGVLGIGIKGGIESVETMQRATDREEKRNHMLVCHRCNRQIVDAVDKSGKAWKAEEISAITTKHYGDALCFPCLLELKAEKTELEV